MIKHTDKDTITYTELLNIMIEMACAYFDDNNQFNIQ